MITIRIRTDNAAFQDGNRADEIARILRKVADQIARHETAKVYDVNGNRVGEVRLTGKDRTL